MPPFFTYLRASPFFPFFRTNVPFFNKSNAILQDLTPYLRIYPNLDKASFFIDDPSPFVSQIEKICLFFKICLSYISAFKNYSS